MTASAMSSDLSESIFARASSGKPESLNISVATAPGLMLYKSGRKIIKKPLKHFKTFTHRNSNTVFWLNS